MLTRLIGFVLTIVATAFFTWQLAWHPEWIAAAGGIGGVLLAALAIVLLAANVFWPRGRWTIAHRAVIGATLLTLLFAAEPIKGMISAAHWWTLPAFIGVILVIMSLGAITVLGFNPLSRQSWRDLFGPVGQNHPVAPVP